LSKLLFNQEVKFNYLSPANLNKENYGINYSFSLSAIITTAHFLVIDESISINRGAYFNRKSP